MMPKDDTKPFRKDEHGKVSVVWRNWLLWKNWKMPLYDVFMILAIVGMTVSYMHDTATCREFNHDPCGYCTQNELGCYAPDTCEPRNPYVVYGLEDIGFNITGSIT